MRTRAIYTDYPSTIEKFRIDFDKEHYIEFIPKQRTITIDGNETIEKYLHVTIYDESIVHQIEAEANLENLKETIIILQSLAKQLKSDKLIVSKC